MATGLISHCYYFFNQQFKKFIYEWGKVQTSMGDSRMIVSESEVTFIIRGTRR